MAHECQPALTNMRCHLLPPLTQHLTATAVLQVLLGMIAMAATRTRTQQVDVLGVRCLVLDVTCIVRADDNLTPSEVFTHHVAEVTRMAREGLATWDRDLMNRALAGAADVRDGEWRV